LICNCSFVFDCFYFRAKLGGNQTESPIIASLSQGIALEFERSDAAKKLRLMLSELLFILQQVFVNSWLIVFTLLHTLHTNYVTYHCLWWLCWL